MKGNHYISLIVLKTIIIILASMFLLTNEAYVFSDIAVKNELSPPASLQLEEFKNSYTVAAICRSIEQYVSINDEEAINNICSWLHKAPHSSIQITPNINEIIIEVPDEGLAIRYFVPGKIQVVTPFSDVLGLQTKVLNPGLCRQVIRRVKRIGSHDRIEDSMRMKVVLEEALKIALQDSKDKCPVAAMVVNERTKERILEVPYSDPGITRNTGVIEHSEIIALKKAVAKGWDLSGCTLYVSEENCYYCAKAVASSFRVGRIVIGCLDENINEMGKAVIEADRIPHEIISDKNLNRMAEQIMSDWNRKYWPKENKVKYEASDIREAKRDPIKRLHEFLFSVAGFSIVDMDLFDWCGHALLRRNPAITENIGADAQVCAINADYFGEAGIGDREKEHALLKHIQRGKCRINPAKDNFVIALIGSPENCREVATWILNNQVIQVEPERLYLLFDEVLDARNKRSGEMLSPKSVLDDGMEVNNIRSIDESVPENLDIEDRYDVYRDYLDKNMEELSSILDGNNPDILLRIPIEAVEAAGLENVKNFLSIFNETSNVYMEFYYVSGIGEEVPPEVYRAYGVKKKYLPETFKISRTNTITLFPSLKGEEITDVSIISRLGSMYIKPTDTILSPIGFQNDLAGLVRSIVLGMRIMGFARDLAEDGNLENDPEFLDRVQLTVMEVYKQVCDPSDRNRLADLKPQDIIALATGETVNDILRPLRKLIKLLPITPIDTEELKRIYEYARQTLMAA